MPLPNRDEPTPETRAAVPTESVSKTDTPKVSFEDLAKGHRIVHIEHGESVYELRLTRNGRLVLYK